MEVSSPKCNLEPPKNGYFGVMDVSYCWWFRNPAFTSRSKLNIPISFLGFHTHSRWLFGISELSTVFHLHLDFPIIGFPLPNHPIGGLNGRVWGLDWFAWNGLRWKAPFWGEGTRGDSRCFFFGGLSLFFRLKKKRKEKRKMKRNLSTFLFF